jgi:AraC-like DNA-binding protein
MDKEIREIVRDNDLNIEAYRFLGVVQEFPNHFHEHYAVGFMESGRRRVDINGTEFLAGMHDLVLLNPLDSHTCRHSDERLMDYRGFNICTDTMKLATFEIFGTEELPRFSVPVAHNSELVPQLRELHSMVMEGSCPFEKEEAFLLMVDQLVREHALPGKTGKGKEPTAEIRLACEFIETHYARRITLDDLSRVSGLEKYPLIRSFTKEKGITPYSYLLAFRIQVARRLLEVGTSLLETALRTGFSDQSHFGNFFKKLIGLTPKQYAEVFHGKGA